MQKLLFILFTSLILFGCDGVEEGLIDPNDVEFSVTDIQAPTHLEYSGIGTRLNTTISFSNSESIIRVWIRVLSQDGTVEITYNLDMDKSADNEYTASIIMDVEMPNLTYTIDYFYQTVIQDEKKIASHNFTYNNNQSNFAPVIEDANIPDQINRDEDFSFTVRVTDENGYSDVEKVFYELFRPNGDQVINSEDIKEFPMFDDGNTAENGDLIVEDSIYTTRLKFPSSVAEIGNWKLELKARDRSGFLSNTITHIVEVK
ncbi:MAG: hypothetical protein PF445_11830 [Melioribacteraceae bacterium]|nr:hypothetical protein [Melioribacteraceae bacterium]